MCIYYFYEHGVPDYVYAVWIRGFMLHNPSESCMMIPGSYAEMMKDYE